MPIQNSDVTENVEKVANLLELEGENQFRVRAYQDACSTSGLDYMRLGIGQARRGWLEKKDVINTRTLKQLKKLLKRG